MENKFYDVLGKPLSKGDLVVYVKTYAGSKGCDLISGLIDGFSTKMVRIRPFNQDRSRSMYPLSISGDSLSDQTISKTPQYIVKVEYPF